MNLLQAAVQSNYHLLILLPQTTEIPFKQHVPLSALHHHFAGENQRQTSLGQA